MPSEEVVLYSTGEAAEHLQVSTRTIRTWIDQFSDYIRPECNDRGHYLLDQGSLDRLRDIQQRLQEPKKKMKQIREDLYKENLLQANRMHEADECLATSNKISYIETKKTLHHVISTIDGVGCMMKEMVERIDHLEDHLYAIYESVEKIDHNLNSLTHETMPASEIRQQLEEIRKKQDQLKIELRNVNLSQRLTSHHDKSKDSKKNESNFVPRRQKKGRFFNLF